MHIARALILGLCASSASAQLYGVTATGALLRIDPVSGAATVIGNSGFGCNAACADLSGRILLAGGSGALADQIITLDPVTAAGSILLNTTGRPVGFGVRGMAMNSSGDLYVVLSSATTTVIDILARIDTTTGAYSVIGPTTRTDLQALAFSPSGNLYSLGILSGGNLCNISLLSGAATLIGSGSFAGDDQALEFLPDGSALACRDNLRSINLATGETTLIGPTGQTDIRGLAYIPEPATSCYPNCDQSTALPVLTANDFTCFLTNYVNGNQYADCDAVGGLTANDFQCFLTAFVAGCS